MHGYNFTERVRKCLALARDEAARLKHEYVGTEHVLLGLVAEGEGVGSTVIENLGVKLEAVREKVEQTVKPGKNVAGLRDLPYTSRAKKVLECAMSEAREMGTNYVGTEHLLLGILREEKGIGAQTLVSLGITLDNARVTTKSILGDDSSGPTSSANAGATPGDVLFASMALPSSPPGVGARLLLTISAAFAVVIGLMLIFNARRFEAPMGIAVDDWTETMAQAQGAILLGLGVINWLGRDVRDRSALWAILYGNFVVQVVSFAVVARALARGLIPAAGFGAMAMHIVLGTAFAWQLWRLKRHQR